MKQLALYILFLFSVAFFLNAAGVFYTPAERISATGNDVPGAGNTDQSISASFIANSYADVSARPGNPFGSNLMRRYRPGGFSVDNVFARIAEEKKFALINSYKNILHSSREYFAQQKLAGYYIYTLCKIII